VAILPNTEKQGELAQSGGWQKQMARRRYQKGSVRKRGQRNPVWELQWWEDYLKDDGTIGRRRESCILGTVSEMSLRQARRAAEEKLRLVNQGRQVPQSTMTLETFIESYVVANFLPTLKASTQGRYRRTLNNHLLPAFGTSRLCDIGSFDLQRFVLQKMEGGLGWESANHLRNLMSKVFALAKQWGYYNGDNPASSVKLPEKQAVRGKHILQPGQIASLLGVLKEPVSTMVLLGVLTGLRIGEILALNWTHVDFSAGEIKVEQAYYRGLLGTPKTKRSRRTVPLPQSLALALMHLKAQGRAENGENELVFRTRNGTPYSDTNLLHRQLKPAGRKLGIPWLNWHTLRRTHATLFQVVGGSLRDAQAQLGHSKMSTTLEHYTLPIPALQRAVVEKLSRLVTNGDELPKFAAEVREPVQPIQ
jgi:integrase